VARPAVRPGRPGGTTTCGRVPGRVCVTRLPGGAGELADVQQGFVDAPLARMGTEKRKRSVYQENRARYRKGACTRGRS
jgi:hypothetical protein